MIKKCEERLADGVAAGTINDYYVTRVGDDINLYLTHNRARIARISTAYAGKIRMRPRLLLDEAYAAGQDLLTDAFGTSAELAQARRRWSLRSVAPSPWYFMADKTEPSSFSLPLCRTYMDPFTTTGLIIDPRAHEGFKFEIVDVCDSKKVVMSSPDEMYDMLALLGDTTRYAIKKIWSKNEDIGIGAVVSTEKLNISAGKYVGKDDPVCVCRTQSGLPAVGEVLQPYMFPSLVAGWMRGSHYGGWYPCSVEDSDPVFFDGPPRIVALGMMVSNGMFQGLEDPNSKPASTSL